MVSGGAERWAWQAVIGGLSASAGWSARGCRREGSVAGRPRTRVRECHVFAMSCPEVVYQAYYPYLYQRASTSAGPPRTSSFPPYYDRVSLFIFYIGPDTCWICIVNKTPNNILDRLCDIFT